MFMCVHACFGIFAQIEALPCREQVHTSSLRVFVRHVDAPNLSVFYFFVARDPYMWTLCRDSQGPRRKSSAVDTGMCTHAFCGPKRGQVPLITKSALITKSF